jgi:glycosyltransferase involved in cell wall biosynthesis
MRVAIDARELRGEQTGVGRYLAGLLDAWETLPAARSHEFVLCAPGPIERASGRVRTVVRQRTIGRAGTAWEQLTLPALVREIEADVLFAPAYTGPVFCPVPLVVAIHDVSFAARPEWFAPREGLRRRILAWLAARRAARVLTISQFSKREIATRLHIDASRIDVAYPGASYPAKHSHVSTAGSTENDQLVLFVGSLFTRRHIPSLIDGFAKLSRQRPGVTLEIVGDNRTTPRVDFQALVSASGAADRITLRSYVAEETLQALYSRARAFVFLSEYEGFGLTPLEALAAGVPIVVLDTPVAREVYQDAAIYLPRPDARLVHAALERVLCDDAERARILEASAHLLPRYSWRTCAEKVLTVLAATAKRE